MPDVKLTDRFMNTDHLESKFTAMGSRLKVLVSTPRGFPGSDFSLDIQRDKAGKFFELRVSARFDGLLEATVLQAEPKQRHLLLLVRTQGLDRFLCGHDERDWFVAAVPGGASSVRQAMDNLQPPAVRAALVRNHIAGDKRHGRKNLAFRRQGEWFFLPAPAVVVEERLTLHNEPLRRSLWNNPFGKPHFVEHLFRTGGESVHVCNRHPDGLDDHTYRKLLLTNPQAAGWQWTHMKRTPKAYARGTVRHSDHKTITLPCWHEVLMNTETKSNSMANVAFLD